MIKNLEAQGLSEQPLKEIKSIISIKHGYKDPKLTRPVPFKFGKRRQGKKSQSPKRPLGKSPSNKQKTITSFEQSR